MTMKYIWRSFSLGCHFHVQFSYPWHAFASHGLPAIAAWASCITRESIYVIARICHANSVRLSVTRVYCIKTAERIVEILSPSDRPIILVFRHQWPLRKSEGVTPNGGAKYKGGSDFRPICGYISETVRDRGIVTCAMEDEYKVVCALSNSAVFDDFEWPRTPVSRSQYSLNANISQTVHPIHSMFCSRLGFSGSTGRYFRFDNIQHGGWPPSWNSRHLRMTALSRVTLASAGLSCACYVYPTPDRSISLFVSLSARLRKNGWTDLHEIFREGVEWLWDDLITFLANSEKPRDATMRNMGAGFVVL